MGDGGRPGSRAGMTLYLRSKSSKPAPCQVPWSDYTTVLALQINTDVVCDFSLGALSETLVCQDPSTGFCKSLPPSQSDFQQSSPTDSPKIPLGQDWSGTHKKGFIMLGEQDVHPGF